MVTMLNLPSLNFYFKRKTMVGAYKLECYGNWWTQSTPEPAGIIDIIVHPIFELTSDMIISVCQYDVKHFFNKTFKLNLDWVLWVRQKPRAISSNDNSGHFSLDILYIGKFTFQFLFIYTYKNTKLYFYKISLVFLWLV